MRVATIYSLTEDGVLAWHFSTIRDGVDNDNFPLAIRAEVNAERETTYMIMGSLYMPLVKYTVARASFIAMF